MFIQRQNLIFLHSKKNQEFPLALTPPPTPKENPGKRGRYPFIVKI
ncbi:hypothetical protein BSPLISOX_1910 [uncultured Gammaproteobacteria bacterium]|nr:hypothetical protein [uncultured Gammaproteobacteria bacterium]VVH67406.1 hypothetical protein BSPLISOX_1910 [uncultured Gammaproteobacteria bacterium]